MGNAVERTLLSERETVTAGHELGLSLGSGDVIGLTGDLGSGKTHLTKGIVTGLGSSADVSSPTFSLVQEYIDGPVPIYHFDFYRIECPEELLEVGWDDYLDRGGVVIAEWAERFRELMPSTTRWWSLVHDQESGGRRLKALP